MCVRVCACLPVSVQVPNWFWSFWFTLTHVLTVPIFVHFKNFLNRNVRTPATFIQLIWFKDLKTAQSHFSYLEMLRKGETQLLLVFSSSLRTRLQHLSTSAAHLIWSVYAIIIWRQPHLSNWFNSIKSTLSSVISDMLISVFFSVGLGGWNWTLDLLLICVLR